MAIQVTDQVSRAEFEGIANLLHKRDEAFSRGHTLRQIQLANVLTAYPYTRCRFGVALYDRDVSENCILNKGVKHARMLRPESQAAF